jgi:hypothetical protein
MGMFDSAGDFFGGISSGINDSWYAGGADIFSGFSSGLGSTLSSLGNGFSGILNNFFKIGQNGTGLLGSLLDPSSMLFWIALIFGGFLIYTFISGGGSAGAVQSIAPQSFNLANNPQIMRALGLMAL